MFILHQIVENILENQHASGEINTLFDENAPKNQWQQFLNIIPSK